MNKNYFSMVQEKNEATINIYGDITSWDWYESDVSSYTLSKQLDALEVDTINVYINSYGGEVAEGLAIYNSLKRHKAKVKTYCDGFACSIASVIFMAGDERIMSTASLLMIHNAWTYTAGNANELRKQAEDLDIITQASINAYMESVNISEEEVKELLDNETWLSSQLAVEHGFATTVISSKDAEKVSQSVKKSLQKMILESQINKVVEEEEPKITEPKPIEPVQQEPAKVNRLGSFFNALNKK
ncbi:MAG: head maturation protease, ClpP-related [Sarcina sp.]